MAVSSAPRMAMKLPWRMSTPFASSADCSVVEFGDRAAPAGLAHGARVHHAIELHVVDEDRCAKYLGWPDRRVLDPISPFQEEARWLQQQPTVDQSLGAPLPNDPLRANYEATFSRMHVAHASIGPSCGLAVYRDGKLQVWTHSQGVYPLLAALARTLKIDPAVISVKHVQGPGCYGHNGADDAAADAAVIAFLKPGTPIRVRWRREEEFGFEPVSPSMVVTVRAILDEAERPIDWTTEIWSGKHVNRPGSGGNLLAAEALPHPPPPPPAFEAPDHPAPAPATASHCTVLQRSGSCIT